MAYLTRGDVALKCMACSQKKIMVREACSGKRSATLYFCFAALGKQDSDTAMA